MSAWRGSLCVRKNGRYNSLRSRSRIFRIRDSRLTSPQKLPDLDREQVHNLLTRGTVEDNTLAPWGSNYTYYVTLRLEDLCYPAVYKPRDGEAPLWDFPDGTLYLREYAAYLVSEWLNWGFIPQTVIREGPYGEGTMQIYVPSDGPPHVYSLTPREEPALQRLVLFDIIANNADRKPAHCFRRPGGGIWAIDHGLTFHPRPKLRTVIWDFSDQPIPQQMVGELESARCDDKRVAEINGRLKGLLTPQEIGAFWRRLDSVVQSKVFPGLDMRYNIPYGFA